MRDAPLRDERPLRILIASHSHPQITRGGAEIAAFQLFREFHDLPGWEAFFLGCQSNRTGERLGASMTQPFSEREWVYSMGSFDWFKFANRDPNFPKAFRSLLESLRPDIVHFHHFLNFGLEAFLHVRDVLPDARIVLTIHEYLLICHHYGQMITKDRESLCYEPSLVRCHQCFPELSPVDFFLRKKYISAFLDLVDHFISPSKFLAERFVAFGIPEHRLTVIENVIQPPQGSASDRPPNQSDPLRIGFFGQISRLKGVNVLFDAAEMLEAEEFRDVVFDIHGDYRGQPPDLQEEFLRRLDGAGRNIRYHGPYDVRRVDQLMHQIDATIVPSIWWENSPVVIQEAFRNRRPVICSDIGGMAEKVRDGEDGWHFPAGSPISLVSVLKRLCSDRNLASRASSATRQPPAVREVVNAHLDLFGTLRTAAFCRKQP